jgi:hypothetical protein
MQQDIAQKELQNLKTKLNLKFFLFNGEDVKLRRMADDDWTDGMNPLVLFHHQAP